MIEEALAVKFSFFICLFFVLQGSLSMMKKLFLTKHLFTADIF